MTLDFRLVARQLGLLLFVLSAMILAVAAFAWVHPGPGGGDLKALTHTGVVGSLIAGLLFVIGRSPTEQFGQREALLLVAASWLLGAALAALPYWIWSSHRVDASTTPHNFDAYVDCYFEAMSGLTTTGATVV